MNIQTMTITELKSLAYDALAQIELNQKNLQVINEEIAKRVKEESEKRATGETEVVKKEDLSNKPKK